MMNKIFGLWVLLFVSINYAFPSEDRLSAPMPGRVTGVLVESGTFIRKGQILATLESMKMEELVRAPKDGYVYHTLTKGLSLDHTNLVIGSITSEKIPNQKISQESLPQKEASLETDAIQPYKLQTFSPKEEVAKEKASKIPVFNETPSQIYCLQIVFPEMRPILQTLENEALRPFLKFSEHVQTEFFVPLKNKDSFAPRVFDLKEQLDLEEELWKKKKSRSKGAVLENSSFSIQNCLFLIFFGGLLPLSLLVNPRILRWVSRFKTRQ